MRSELKFPPSVEIKRAIAAVARAGIVIGRIEIESKKVTVYAVQAEGAASISAYDQWKLFDGLTHQTKHQRAKSEPSGTKGSKAEARKSDSQAGKTMT